MRETDGVAPKLWESHNREALNAKSLDKRAENVRTIRSAEKPGNAPSLEPQVLRVFESSDPERFVLESWQFSAFAAVSLKRLLEPSEPKRPLDKWGN